MATSDRLTLVDPTKLWLWLALVMTATFAVGSLIIAKSLSEKNSNINQLRLNALLRNNQSYLLDGNYRKFIEGLGPDFNAFNVSIVGAHKFEFGAPKLNGICSSGFSSDANAKVTICRRYDSYAPKIFVYSAFFCLALLAVFLLAKRHDTRVFERLCGLLENYDVQIDENDDLSSVLRKLKEMRHRELDLLATSRTEQKMLRFIHNLRTDLNIISNSLKVVDANESSGRGIKAAQRSAERIDKQREEVMQQRKRSIEFARIGAFADLNCILIDLVNEQMLLDPSVKIHYENDSKNVRAFALCDVDVFSNILQGIVTNARENCPQACIHFNLSSAPDGQIVKIRNAVSAVQSNEVSANSPILYGFETTKNGVGLYHAKNEVESWGGVFEIDSTEEYFEVRITLKSFDRSINAMPMILKKTENTDSQVSTSNI